MTNAEIIEKARFDLMKEGKLKGTGEFLKVQTDKGEMVIEIPEEMHTFAFWKEKRLHGQEGRTRRRQADHLEGSRKEGREAGRNREQDRQHVHEERRILCGITGSTD